MTRKKIKGVDGVKIGRKDFIERENRWVFLVLWSFRYWFGGVFYGVFINLINICLVYIK